jgi:hypothetical protein
LGAKFYLPRHSATGFIVVRIAIQTKGGKVSNVVHLQRNGATVTACTTQTRRKVAWFPEIVA